MFDQKIVKFPDMKFENKEDVVAYLADFLYEENKISDKKEYIKAVMKREAVMPTEIGYFIAIPHGESKSVNESFCACVKLKNPIIWGKEEVKYVFNIGVPIEQRNEEHIRILSRLCSDLMLEDFRNSLYACETEKELYEKMESITKEE